MKKEKCLLSVIVVLVIFLLFSPKVFAKKNQKRMCVDASEFAAYLPKDGAKESNRYRYDEKRQLIIVVCVKADSLITIRYDLNSKREKKLSLKRDSENPSVFYLVSPKISQKKFDDEIKQVLSILNVN